MSQTFIGDLSIVECCLCHTTFGMTQELNKQRLDDGKSFWCPNGHNQHYTKSNIKFLEEKLAAANERERLEREAKERAWSREKVMSNRYRAQKGIATKIKNRVGNGVCPCCNRTFQNLLGHMRHQHPKWKVQ